VRFHENWKYVLLDINVGIELLLFTCLIAGYGFLLSLDPVAF